MSPVCIYGVQMSGQISMAFGDKVDPLEIEHSKHLGGG